MWPTVMALGVSRQAPRAGGSIISVNLGEPFMGAGGNVDGLLGIYLFQLLGELEAAGVCSAPLVERGPSPAPSPGGLITSRVGEAA